ncbi:hypothetical protein BH23ACT3_BH23ACT3_08780 [soil metagenome]
MDTPETSTDHPDTGIGPTARSVPKPADACTDADSAATDEHDEGASIAAVHMSNQVTVQDGSWMRAVIPHHSIAILTSERAEIDDVRVCELAKSIIEAQQREIDEMDWLISDISDNDKASTAEEAKHDLFPSSPGSPSATTRENNSDSAATAHARVHRERRGRWQRRDQSRRTSRQVQGEPSTRSSGSPVHRAACCAIARAAANASA